MDKKNTGKKDHSTSESDSIDKSIDAPNQFHGSQDAPRPDNPAITQSKGRRPSTTS